jgi:DNA polymerase-3 subunit alpha
MLQSRALGNFTRGMSDTLRKAMGKKQFEMMAKLKGQFIDGCKNNPEFVKGAAEKGKEVEPLVDKIWGDWEAFASYAFNKSHSVCYAYIAYQTGYLKTHYPAEFMAANLSNNLSDITKVTIFMDECKRMGLNVLAPDVNESYNDFMVNAKGEIRFGMAAIKGVGEGAVEKIIEEREKRGHYKDVYDFFERVDYRTANKKTLESLITAGGLDSFGYHRAQYFKEVDAHNIVLDVLVNYGQKKQQDAMSMQATLFGELEGFEVAKPRIPDCEPWHDFEKSQKEKNLIGIYLTSHPLDPYKLEMEMLCTPLEQLNQGLGQFKDKEITIAGIIIDIKTGKTSKGTDYGRVTIEDFSGTYELAFYGKDYIKWHNFFSAETAICIKGKVGPKWGKEGNELALSIQMMDLLETITENTIRSITLQVQIEQLTSSDVTEIYNLFAVNVMAEKESKEEKKLNLLVL